MKQGFHKSERLCSRTLTERLFAPGASRSASAWPMRMIAATEPGDEPNQLLISVPKRHMHHAVDRNRVKRQVREAYRTQKQLLRVPEGRHAIIAVIWNDSHHHPTPHVQTRMASLLERLSLRLCEE